MPASVRVHARPVAAHISKSSIAELGAASMRAPGDEASAHAALLNELNEYRESKAVLESIVAALSGAAQELETTHQKFQEEAPAFAIRLAVGIAQELVRTELHAGNYDIEAIVRSALAVANTGRSACTIHLHPDDLTKFDASRFRSNTRFESDPDIARGDVHITTPQGLLVRDIDATLTRVREELLEANR